jgi:hypothetical protein
MFSGQNEQLFVQFTDGGERGLTCQGRCPGSCCLGNAVQSGKARRGTQQPRKTVETRAKGFLHDNDNDTVKALGFFCTLVLDSFFS